MAIAARDLYVTPQEYLTSERKAETRSEYFGGIVVAMAGASWEHIVITGSISHLFWNQFENTDCAVVTNDMRVRVPECNRYYYPDVVVVCGEPQLEDAELDTLLNPKLIIEVLSESTEKTDRGEKSDCYRTLDSLDTYVLVAQDRPCVELASRQPDGTWPVTVAEGLDAAVSFDSIGATLRLSEIYARVKFPATARVERDGPEE